MTLLSTANAFGAMLGEPELPVIDRVPMPSGFSWHTLRDSRRAILEAAARGELDRDEAEYLLSEVTL